MRTRLVRIGNSRGIRIPKPLIEQAGLGEEVQISVEENRLVITSERSPRLGWDQAFQDMAAAGDDHLLDDLPPRISPEEDDEWEW